jgi:glycosyltransferase involved in cell wall biosynthesis
MLRSQDICLGIFGNTAKAARVIPNKIYEAAALGKAIITADTPAIRELFTDRQDILLCKRSDPADLAEKIMLLKNDTALRRKIADGALRLFRERCTPAAIGRGLIAELEPLCKKAS